MSALDELLEEAADAWRMCHDLEDIAENFDRMGLDGSGIRRRAVNEGEKAIRIEKVAALIEGATTPAQSELCPAR